MPEIGINQKVINEIQKLAVDYQLKTVILFGSRARGDFNCKSDIDLAVNGGDISQFSAAVDEETSTLLDFDIIDLGEPIQENLRNAIREEGLIIYEKV